MGFRNSPWSGRQREGFFIYREIHGRRVMIFCDVNKEKVFAKHAELEKEGVVCWIEDEKGERLT